MLFQGSQIPAAVARPYRREPSHRAAPPRARALGEREGSEETPFGASPLAARTDYPRPPAHV